MPKHANSALRVTRIDPIADPRWEAYVAAHAMGTVYFHPGWLRALRAETGTELIGLACEDRSGTVRGVLPLMATRGLPFNLGGQQTGRRLTSLPRTPVAGPLADDDAVTAMLLAEAISALSELPGGTLQLKVPGPGYEALEPRLVGEPWRLSYLLELPGPPARLRFGNARNNSRIRWAINKATRMGVRVRDAETEADLRAWYHLYLLVLRHRAVPPRSYRFFAALWEHLRPRGMLRLLLAEQDGARDPRLLAGSIFLSLGETVHYAFNGARRADFALRPNDLVLWHAIQDAAADGRRRFDLGEVSDDQSQLAHFKLKWGAREVQPWRYYYPAPRGDADLSRAQDAHGGGRLGSAAEAAWKRLPLRVTSLLGEWLYRRL